MLRFLSLLFVSLALAGCIQPQSEWKITHGSDFPDPKVETLKEGEATAGAVIQALGVPYRRRDDTFVYAVRRVRDVERSFVVYQQPMTQEVTIQTTILFNNGVVADIETRSYERFFPEKAK